MPESTKQRRRATFALPDEPRVIYVWSMPQMDAMYGYTRLYVATEDIASDVFDKVRRPILELEHVLHNGVHLYPRYISIRWANHGIAVTPEEIDAKFDEIKNKVSQPAAQILAEAFGWEDHILRVIPDEQSVMETADELGVNWRPGVF